MLTMTNLKEKQRMLARMPPKQRKAFLLRHRGHAPDPNAHPEPSTPRDSREGLSPRDRDLVTSALLWEAQHEASWSVPTPQPPALAPSVERELRVLVETTPMFTDRPGLAPPAYLGGLGTPPAESAQEVVARIRTGNAPTLALGLHAQLIAALHLPMRAPEPERRDDGDDLHSRLARAITRTRGGA